MIVLAIAGPFAGEYFRGVVGFVLGAAPAAFVSGLHHRQPTEPRPGPGAPRPWRTPEERSAAVRNGFKAAGLVVAFAALLALQQVVFRARG